MNREQIVERVAAKVYKGCYPEFDRHEIDEHITDVLEKAGFWELLEAAEFAKEAIIELQDNKDGGLISPARYKLKAAIAKITGAGDGQ